MRIIIDARLWSESGIGRYVRNLIEGLQRADHQNEYYVLHLQDDFDKLVYRAENFHKILADFRWYTFSEQIKLPKIINSLKPDLIHFPHFNVPIFYKGKFVVTIHDLIHQHFQTRDASTHGPIIHTIKKIGYRKTFSHAVSGSSKIITPSNFVKEQLVNEWNVPEGKITITYEAVEDNFLRLAQKANGKITVKKPYLFYVGNAQPHKNLLILIKVFKKLKEKYQDLSLVLSGPPHKFWEDIKAVSHIGGVIFTGFVSDNELAGLYKNAKIFVMPSLEEGFGLPVLEAMAAGCPIASSNAGSLPEVGGNALLYFDPKNENDIAEKISQALDDKNLRNDLIKKGKIRYKQFSWQKLAEQTLGVYRSS